MNETRFPNRREAGKRLAKDLEKYKGRDDVLVLALPRGGVPVAYEVARALDAPLDVFVVRKIGVPGHEELAMGAIATGGVRVMNPSVVRSLGVPDDVIEEVTQREQEELARREQAYRGDRPPLDVTDKCVILIDDGLATGASMRAAVSALKTQDPAEVVVAVPTAAPDTSASLVDEVDNVVCVIRPHQFMGVGAWYEDFSQTTDEEVRDLLAQTTQPGEQQAS